MKKHPLFITAALMAAGALPGAMARVRDIDGEYQDAKELDRLRSNLPPPSGFRSKTHAYALKHPTTEADNGAIGTADLKRLRRVVAREQNRIRSIEGQKRALAKLKDSK